MLIHMHPDNPQPRLLRQVVDTLKSGGIIVYPTDTIYGLGCDILQHKAVERICRIKGVDPQKAQLSFICYDLSDLSQYAAYAYLWGSEIMPVSGAFSYYLGFRMRKVDNRRGYCATIASINYQVYELAKLILYIFRIGVLFYIFAR